MESVCQVPSVGGGECQVPSVEGGECQVPSVGGGECQVPSVGGRECQVPSVGGGEDLEHLTQPCSGTGSRRASVSPTHQGTKAGLAWQPWPCDPHRLWTLFSCTPTFLRTCHRMRDPDSSGSR